MKLAIVGKGGSGKSTVSWLVVNELANNGYRTLAIDADYNMDLCYNLNASTDSVKHINTSEKDFYRYLGLTTNDYYVNLPDKENLRNFKLNPKDEFTDKYSTKINDNLHLMITGTIRHTQLYSHRCNHAFITPLKYYLPLLKLDKSEAVVVDSVAGTDLVSYGMFLGVDSIIVIVEPTPHSINVYKQVVGIARQFSIQVKIILNKYRENKHILEFEKNHEVDILARIPNDDSIMNYDYSSLPKSIKESTSNAIRQLSKQGFDSEQQWQRHVLWKEKYDMQKEESKKDPYSFVAK